MLKNEKKTRSFKMPTPRNFLNWVPRRMAGGRGKSLRNLNHPGFGSPILLANKVRTSTLLEDLLAYKMQSIKNENYLTGSSSTFSPHEKQTNLQSKFSPVLVKIDF